MGLFGFLGEITQAAVKTVLISATIAKDAVDIILGDEPVSTTDNIESIGESLDNAGKKLLDEF